MATIVEPAAGPPDAEARLTSERRPRTRFYLGLALVCALIAIGGFAPSYWLQLPAGTFKGAPLLHIHGALATAWVLFLISQSTLVTRGSVARHRDWGLFGISLASVLTIVAMMVAIQAMTDKLAAGGGDPVRAFLIVPMTGIVMFAGFTAAAVANIRRPEWHRRFMIVGTVALLGAAMARVFFFFAVGGGPGVRPGLMGAPPPPAMPLVSGLLLQLIIVAGMVHDKRKHGRIHPAWIYGFVILTAVTLLRVPLGETNLWLGIADWLGRIAG
jgi:FtsH-binding integral membrane protein